MIHAIEIRNEYGRLGQGGVYELSGLRQNGETKFAHNEKDALDWVKQAEITEYMVDEGRTTYVTEWVEIDRNDLFTLLHGEPEEATHRRTSYTVHPVATVQAPKPAYSVSYVTEYRNGDTDDHAEHTRNFVTLRQAIAHAEHISRHEGISDIGTYQGPWLSQGGGIIAADDAEEFRVVVTITDIEQDLANKIIYMVISSDDVDDGDRIYHDKKLAQDKVDAILKSHPNATVYIRELTQAELLAELPNVDDLHHDQ